MAKARGNRSRVKIRARRALKAKLFEQQSGLCWICEKLMRKDVRTHHDLYPTFDHVKERSLGGSSDEANLKLAHRVCNNRRSNGSQRDVWLGSATAQPFSSGWLRAKGYL